MRFAFWREFFSKECALTGIDRFLRDPKGIRTPIAGTGILYSIQLNYGAG